MTKLAVLFNFAQMEELPCPDGIAAIMPHRHPGKVIDQIYLCLDVELPFIPTNGAKLIFPFNGDRGQTMELRLADVGYLMAEQRFVAHVHHGFGVSPEDSEAFRKMVLDAESIGAKRSSKEDYLEAAGGMVPN